MYYIQFKYKGQPLETIAEYDCLRQAREDLREYRFADPYASYYLSQRACKAWRESK